VEGCCEHGNEPSGSVKREILEWLSDCRLLKNSVPWSFFFSQSKIVSLVYNPQPEGPGKVKPVGEPGYFITS
jgi:hypothetical protein